MSSSGLLQKERESKKIHCEDKAVLLSMLGHVIQNRLQAEEEEHTIIVSSNFCFGHVQKGLSSVDDQDLLRMITEGVNIMERISVVEYTLCV